MCKHLQNLCNKRSMIKCYKKSTCTVDRVGDRITCINCSDNRETLHHLLAVRFLLLLKYNIKRPVIRPGPGVIHIGGLITVWECLQYTRILRHNAALMVFAVE